MKNFLFLFVCLCFPVCGQDADTSEFFVRDVFITEDDRKIYHHYLFHGLRLSEQAIEHELYRWEYAVSIALFNDVYYEYASVAIKNEAHQLIKGHLKGKLSVSVDDLILQGKQRLREHQHWLDTQHIDEPMEHPSLVPYLFVLCIVVGILWLFFLQ